MFMVVLKVLTSYYINGREESRPSKESFLYERAFLFSPGKYLRPIPSNRPFFLCSFGSVMSLNHQ